MKIKKTFLGLLAALAGLILPLKAQAFIGPLAGLIASYLGAFVVQMMLRVSNLILQLSVAFLEWVISDGFIRLSYTQLDNPIIAIGWPLTRDLVNMFFFIMLIFIGIGTALRIEDYKAQKTIIPLVLMALLINFTPVITGLIVDASNIFMNFFLSGVSGLKTISSEFQGQLSVLSTGLSGWYNPLNAIATVFQGMSLVVFSGVTAAVLFIFSFLFIVRRLAIWLLVILSPIAFAAYIFPSTRRYWSGWWQQFLNWCFIGVIASFFLYLGNMLIVNINAIRPTTPPTSGDMDILKGVVEAMVPYLIADAFLFIGLMSGFSGSAMGASAVVGFAKKAPRQIARLGKKGLTEGGKAIAKGIGKTEAGSRAEAWAMRNLEKVPLAGRAFGGRGAFDKKLQERTGESQKKIEQIALAPDGEDRILKIATGNSGSVHERAAAANWIAKNGKMPDPTATTDPAAQAQRRRQLDDMRKNANNAAKLNLNMKDVYDTNPDWVADSAKVPKGATPAQATQAKNNAISKHVSKMSPDKVAELSPDKFDNENIVKGINHRQASRLVANKSIMEMQKINDQLAAAGVMIGGGAAGGRAFNNGRLVPSTINDVSGFSRDFVNYIVTQQLNGNWPKI